ncbi:hypothetical protein JD844_031658 [Phrynosoma platyrhinos]|uniref:Trehalase n=1 Tax=Phrynosoma platyrhinos TaxID=52577 RepID=A0ABQ7T1C3_PHRPL|nr:hypothetical protein JD844_031658 [Phrynosoma platyrhinos]
MLWSELHSGAESGWDFSSRWFLPGPPPLQATLQDTKTSAVVPVDLNAILCRVEKLLASFHQTLGLSSSHLQEGFGWTNGVALKLLDLYGDRLTSASASALSGIWLWICPCLLLALA